MKKMSFLVVGLGSNLGVPKAKDGRKLNLEKAIELLLKNGMVLECKSHIYETKPEGLIRQPMFLNMVLGLKTELKPEICLKLLQQIENDLGRQRGIKNGPRTIDLDILFYDQIVLVKDDLVIPHPRLHQRSFVLVPLAEILPNFVHPVFNQTVAELLAKVNCQGVKLWN